MGMIERVSRVAPRFAIVLLLAVLAAAAYDLTTWWRLARLERAIEQVASTPPADSDAPELRFARAAHLGSQRDYDAAVNLYRALHLHEKLSVPARYNAGNLLMRQADELRQQTATAGQAVALVELAKQLYREVLRAQPEHWEARYNHERAQRLQPEPETGNAAISQPQSNVERATATSRGVQPGLP